MELEMYLNEKRKVLDIIVTGDDEETTTAIIETLDTYLPSMMDTVNIGQTMQASVTIAGTAKDRLYVIACNNLQALRGICQCVKGMTTICKELFN